jgi:hypothetical protein
MRLLRLENVGYRYDVLAQNRGKGRARLVMTRTKRGSAEEPDAVTVTAPQLQELLDLFSAAERIYQERREAA